MKQIYQEQRDEIVRKYAIREGIARTVGTISAVAGFVAPYAKLILTKEEPSYSPEMVLASSLITPVISGSLYTVFNKLNKRLEKKTLNKLEDSIK